MIIGVDIETKGLDATKFLCGSMVKESGKKEFFTRKRDMWKAILEEGERERKRKKRLHVYGHNHQYDFYGYANLKDRNITFESLNPFIASYGKDKQIMFLDSAAVFKMDLEKLGKAIGKEKLKMNEKNLKEYNERDAEIVMLAIKELREKLKKERMNCKTLITAGQIASKYIQREVMERCPENFFQDWKCRKTVEQKLRKKVRKAYRGGRVEAMETGAFKDTTMIDANSLYPYACTLIPFPKLTSETLTKEPSISILKEMGTSTAIIRKRREETALMPIRDGNDNLYPRHECLMYGTWTNLELAEAMANGYEIMKIMESVTYETENENPLRNCMERLYKLRKESGNEFDNLFYKTMMNHAIGKMAQERGRMEIKIDNVEEAANYKKNGYTIVGAIGYNYVYKKETPKEPSKMHAIIIPAYVNAMGRIIMFRMLKKLGEGNALYCDTDSVILKDTWKKDLEIGERMGQWKIEGRKKDALIYAKKSYMFGETIRLSGIGKIFTDKKNFEEGKITYKRMASILKGDKAGTFKEDTRDLMSSMGKEMERKERERETMIFIDEAEEDKIKAAEEAIYLSR